MREVSLQAKECQQLPETTKLLEKGMGLFLPQSPQNTNHADTLILDFQSFELWDNTFLLFKTTQFVVRCYGIPRKGAP